MSKLAINGGEKVRKKPFPAYKIITEEEIDKTVEVLKSGIISKYLGCWDPDFYGGDEVQAFEKEWAEMHHVKHAITVNSNTTGIWTALGALNIGPGDEVIVSPYTMTISASAPLFWGAIPVFADIEAETFCLDPNSVEAAITERTKAIIAVDLFGHPYNAAKINEIAKKHKIKIIEDCAQAPLASFKEKFAGSLGDIGVFSLNYHKHIHTGEGGVIVTNDDDLAVRCQLLRNHAEAVVDDMGYKGNPINMVGLNLRLTEIQAGFGRLLLKKLPNIISKWRDNANYLESKINNIPFLEMPTVASGATHSYYVHTIKFNKEKADGVNRNDYVDAVIAELEPYELREAEGVQMGAGYIKPLYLQSLYQERKGIYQVIWTQSDVSYKKGICPVAERMHEKEVITHEFIRSCLSNNDIDDVANAFQKVAENLNEIK